MNKTKNHPHENLSPAGVVALIQDQPDRSGVKRVLKGLLVAVAVVSLHHSASAAPGGTDILHFTAKTAMVNAGVDPNAHGRIEEDLKVQGKADNQRLRISLAKLTPNTAYQLVAFLGDETNATSVAEFTTDRKGSFAVGYAKKSQGHQSTGVKPLPDALNPMCNVRELSVLNANTQAVLRGILTSPDKGQYLVKRTMHNTGFQTAAVGNLKIIATSRLTQFQLRASHLTPSTDYQLRINGNLAQTYTSDTAGRLNLKSLPVGSPNALHIQTLALTDVTGTNVVLISGGLGIPCTSAAQAALSLGTAASFGVLAGSTVANTGPTTLRGDLGVSPGSAVTGFPPGIVIGTQHVADPAAAQAQLDLTTAYNAAAGQTVGAVLVAGNLGGLTLAPGLYKSTSSLEISSGDLTLNAQGNANAVFIFQMASTLTTTSGRQVILSGGAKAANIFWQVGTSAALGTTSVFKGTIMADQSITLATGASLEGRALARIGGVTMDSNVITVPAP